MPKVTLKNISKRYGNIIANDQINLTINNEEYVSIIGPSGCGKTTLIKIISGIIKPDEGGVYVNDRLINKTPIEERGIGYVFQNIALFPHKTVWENIIYGPKIKGIHIKQIEPLAHEMLDMIKIGARSDDYPSELSGGTQQKTAVARALMSKAELLLLDEPLGALDLKVRGELRYEIRRLVKALKLTAIHVTHDQEEAMSISDRVIVMKNGKIVEYGSPSNLYANPKNIFTANFVGEANFLKGTIHKITNRMSLVKFGEHFLKSKNRNISEGSHVLVAFRPEFVSISTQKKSNDIPGRIIEIIYTGKLVRLKVELMTRENIVIKKMLDRKESSFSLNDNVFVNVSPENVLLYSYPKGGLHKELALE
jgi:ABC-type Fe3+/spermidine/putrescine transport system ATPase subunit